MSKEITLICGPTAVGKTAYALRLVEEAGAEIVSADSGQIYRGMDVGTAKPSPQERQRVPFHLIDILNPNETFSAADFRERALHVIQDIRGRGKEPLMVGGTGLYMKVLEEGVFEGPKRDEAVRRQIEIEIEAEGLEAVHQKLAGVDPEAAKTIPAGNRQRLIRALEVYRLTGKPISAFWQEHQKRPGALCFKKIGLTLPKEELHRRIENRIDEMLQKGLVKEVEKILAGWGEEAPGLKLIGYKEIVSYLKGRTSQAEAIVQIKTNTRQYAKRQITWFRKDPAIEWRDARSLS